MTTTHVRTHELVLPATEVRERLAREAVTDGEGIRRAVLWERRGSTAGLLVLAPGARIGAHVHPAHEHHVWVTKGRAEVRGTPLKAGSYWYVSAGADHTLVAADEGCELFYLYLAAG